MARMAIVFGLTLLGITVICQAENNEPKKFLTDFNRFNNQLADKGIDLDLRLTSVYQANVHGGISTSNHKGRNIGRYEFAMNTDLEKLFGLQGGSFYIVGWGGWPDTEGIDSHSVASSFGTNALAIGNRSMDVVECAYTGPFTDNVSIMIGKLDFSGIFDTSAYANDECCKFLNGALVNNATVPFPQQGLGTVVKWDMTDSWYLMSGAADAQADSRETGFRTTFHDEDYFFYALETGLTAGAGNYRLGLWNDAQPKANSDSSETKRDDVGAYTSCDWLLYKENADDEDDQGLGTFVRYGYAPGRKNDITNFYSFGLQYRGLVDGRDYDLLGIGYAQGIFSDSASASFPSDYESVLEAYYDAQITRYFVIGPSVQYIANPSDGSSTSGKDAILVALRAQLTF